MTQKDKELLLKDLCIRLPYNVKCWVVGEKQPLTLTTIEVDSVNGHLFRFQELRRGFIVEVYTSELKPYLFPMSSMTEEQKKEYKQFFEDIDGYAYSIDCVPQTDWLNKNYFDYRDRRLIPLGLAIDATGLNIY